MRRGFRGDLTKYLPQRLNAAPVEAPFVAHAGQQAQSSQVIVDEAARAETHGQVDTRQYKNDQIERPTDCCSLREVEYERSDNEKCCADALGEAVWSRIILDDARLCWPVKIWPGGYLPAGHLL